jgi:hypothetical protein
MRNGGLVKWFLSHLLYYDRGGIYKKEGNRRRIGGRSKNECEECHEEALEHTKEACDPICCRWEYCPRT